jgi:ABC-2 type transport system ATP-binding protein
MASPVLSVHQLTKTYGEYLAVDHISFEIAEGEILGLLGPNGAGKSTTMQMLLGLTEPDSGEIRYFDKNFVQNKEYCLSRINFASTYAELNIRMTVYQSLKIFCGLYNVKDAEKRIHELTRLLECEECLSKQFWHLSSGQKTRVILAKSLLNRPKMLLMDEPTASLDPDIVAKIIQLIKKMQEQEKMTILFTSHNMDEVARLCDRVAFLVKGKIMIIDTPLELTKKIGGAMVTLNFDGDKKIVADYLNEEKYKYTFVTKNLVEITVPETDIPKLLFELKKKEVWITSISIDKPSLEDVFLHISRNETL